MARPPVRQFQHPAVVGNARGQVQAAPPGHSAGLVATAAALRNVAPGAVASRCLGALAERFRGRRDRLNDEQAARMAGIGGQGVGPAAHVGPEEVRQQTRNLPVVVTRAVYDSRRAAGRNIAPFDPSFHQVRHLPGYLQEPIRAMGRDAFESFTPVPIEEIQVLAWLNPQSSPGSPNPKTDVEGLAGWVTQNGIREDAAVMESHGYKAETQLWRTAQHDFLLVRDSIDGQTMGLYVYAWAGGRGVHLENTVRRAVTEGNQRPNGDLESTMRAAVALPAAPVAPVVAPRAAALPRPQATAARGGNVVRVEAQQAPEEFDPLSLLSGDPVWERYEVPAELDEEPGLPGPEM